MEPTPRPRRQGETRRWPHALTVEELRHRYLVERQSLRQIAAAAGITPEAVYQRCKRYGIPRRPRGGPNALGKTWRWER